MGNLAEHDLPGQLSPALLLPDLLPFLPPSLVSELEETNFTDRRIRTDPWLLVGVREGFCSELNELQLERCGRNPTVPRRGN